MVTAFHLRILAMVTMLCDHLWGTVVPGNEWLTCVGRLAFPIFAFQIVEGYAHTRNLKKYVLRLLVFALLSELPFNYAIGGRWLYPIHQNVLWTFLIAIGMIWLNEKQRGKGLLRRVAVGFLTLLLGSLAGLVTMVDYYHAGVLTVLLFYFTRNLGKWRYPAQLFGMWYINWEILGGLVYEFSLLGHTVVFPQQGFALLALIPIWLYRGEQGSKSKALRRCFYWFYPIHLLLLGLAAQLF